MLLFLAFMRAAFTVELIGYGTFKCILNDIMSLIEFQEILNFLHESIEKFISIALNHWIDGYSFVGDE
jgi:hypothetical protein